MLIIIIDQEEWKTGGETREGECPACKLRNSTPTTVAIGTEDEVDELLVFFGGPWPLLQPDFVAARSPPHL